MEVWKISDAAVRKLLARAPDAKRLLYFERATSSTYVTPYTQRELRIQDDAQRVTLQGPALDSVLQRLIRAWAAATSDPLPPEVEAEACLMLSTQPDLHLEYMGRGRVNEALLGPVDAHTLFTLDRAGGR